MPIRIYNTQSRRKEDFVPLEEGVVRMYSCGPTVYDYFHIGNARAFVVPDVIKRYLEFRGYKVRHVQNITDIEDKIIARANERGISTKELVAEYARAFYEDSRALGNRPATVTPRATEHISQIVDLVKTLIDKGYAYEVDGDVYFEVAKFKDYGKLSGQSLEELMAGARVEIDERKRSSADFALWKKAKPGEPAWDSPWGPGRPGWHIECSAMSMAHLGESIDIHTGGVDLVFPHHENEIAQSEAATGKPFVRYWVHNGFINIDGQRMGKSLGNFKTVRDLRKVYHPLVLRYFLLTTHYRNPINFGDEEVTAAGKGLERLYKTVLQARRALLGGSGAQGSGLGEAGTQKAGEKGAAGLKEVAQDLRAAADKAREDFIEAMDDDFNTAQAIGVIHELARAIRSALSSPGFSPATELGDAVRHANNTLRSLGEVLGILGDEAEASLAEGFSEESLASDDKAEGLVDGLMDLILKIRQDARKRKDWATADEIRCSLAALGIAVEDTPQGPRWRLAKNDG